MAILNTSLYRAEEDEVFSGDGSGQKLYERVTGGKGPADAGDEWDVFRRLSPLRHNILCWYPFRQGCSILEIGTNCGEITGLLIRKAKQVTTCEKTMLRAKTIYERFSGAENLEIVAGDFRKLPGDQKYDYIVLNGTLETAGETIAEGNPYTQMLREAGRYLKDDGIMLIATDNRLGLRYFSGAPEEHEGKAFAGIDGYPEGDRGRTFDRKELEDLCREAGLRIGKWYYPFPDYRFTREIFTDRSINEQIPHFADELSGGERITLFSEQKVQRSLAENGIAQYFCNSFLIEVSKAEGRSEGNGIDYVKLSNDRKEQFAQYTILDYEAGKVYKVPYTEAGKAHLQRMCGHPFEAGRMKTLPYTWDGEKATCELLRSETLLDQLNRYAEKDQRDDFWNRLKELKAILYSQTCGDPDDEAAFEKVFGDRKAEASFHRTKGITIDCMAGNIYAEGDRWILIDYEWTFDFPVPAEYILWRTIHQLRMYPNLQQVFEAFDTNGFIGIDEDSEAAFTAWEDHFENQYVGIDYPQRGGKTRIQADTLQAENEKVEKENAELTRERKELSIQKKKAENELRMTAEALREIQESGMYRFSLKYYKVRDRIFAPGSRRQAFMKALFSRGRARRAKSGSGSVTGAANKNQIDGFFAYGQFDRMGIVTTPHTMYVAKLIERELAKLSIRAEISEGEPARYQDMPYVIICPQFVKRFPPVYIAVQMEQTVSSRWFNEEYLVKLQNSCAIFDYSLENIDFYQQGTYKDLYRRVYYVPIDYHPGLQEAQEEPEKAYDVIFYGDAKSCERRRKMLDELKKEFRVKVCSEVFGEDVYREIRKAKVLVNIHYYEGALLETTRLYETLSLNSCVIVSEDSKDRTERGRLETIVDFTEIGNIGQMKQRIRYWVNHDEEREARIRENQAVLENRPNAFTFFFQRFMLAYDRIDFDRFYRLAGDYVRLGSDRICLSLPESTVRRRAFDSANRYGFECFPGLRHVKGWVGCGLSYKMIFTKATEAGMKEIMICEDDVIFPPDFGPQIERILRFLHSRERWSVFSGLIADAGKVTAVTEQEESGNAAILKIDHMVSTVFNIYNEEVFPCFTQWDEQNRDVDRNAIDRYLENKDLAIYVRVPFLVGHDEELDSSVWGFSNVAYIDWIRKSEDRLTELAAAFRQGQENPPKE